MSRHVTTREETRRDVVDHSQQEKAWADGPEQPLSLQLSVHRCCVEDRDYPGERRGDYRSPRTPTLRIHECEQRSCTYAGEGRASRREDPERLQTNEPPARQGWNDRQERDENSQGDATRQEVLPGSVDERSNQNRRRVARVQV